MLKGVRKNYMIKMTMKYILIDKNNKEGSSTFDRNEAKKMFQKIYSKVTNETFGLILGEETHLVLFRISCNRNPEFTYLQFTYENTENVCAEVLNEANRLLLAGEHRKSYAIVTTYDCISSFYCNKISPKFNEFERLMRELIFNTIIKAFGIDWYQKSFSKEIKQYFKERGHGNDSKLVESALYELDIQHLEEYLFAPYREVDFYDIINNTLSCDNIITMEKDEIVDFINRCREQSLWERFFLNSTIGLPEIDKDVLDSIRTERNKIAHNKFFYKTDYEKCLKQLNTLNSTLKNAIAKMEDVNYTEMQLSDILGAIGKLFVNVLGNYQSEFGALVSSMFKALSLAQSIKTPNLQALQSSSLTKAISNYQINSELQGSIKRLQQEASKMQKSSVQMAAIDEAIKAQRSSSQMAAIKEAAKISSAQIAAMKEASKTEKVITSPLLRRVKKNREIRSD